MTNWPSIQANKYALRADTLGEVSYAHLSDTTRVLVIVLSRLDLIEQNTAYLLAIKTGPLRDFGKRWWERTHYSALINKGTNTRMENS